MMVKAIRFGAVLALVAAAPAQAGEELLFGPVPDWVEAHPVELPEGPPTDQPVRLLLLDNQVRMEDGKRQVHTAVALRLQTTEGLSAGNLSLPWRPETDELTVHKVLIRRGDEVIDVLESGQTFTTLRREQNLEQAVLDGVLTANMIPEDLQVGDVLEVAYTVAVDNPVFGAHDEALLGPMNAPIDRAYARFLWPQSETMRLARSPGMPEWKRARKDGYETALIALEDVVTTPSPDGAPARYGFIGFVEASDYASWSELSTHFAPIYAEAAVVPASGPLRNEVERIRAASSDPVAQAEAALALVQGRVRYVALAMGIGGLVPATAAETWSRRFGDCKAKTALLLAILGELGIEAEPVVVNTVLGDGIPERLPMIGLFNHVLVRAHIGGRDYWLDGTRTGDTSLAQVEVPNFAWGLPIMPGGAEPVRMLPPPYDEPTEDMAIELDASKGLRAPVPAKVELIMRGDSARGTNQLITGLVGDERDRALREFWRNRFDFIEAEEVGHAFDPAAVELRLTLAGKATLDWDGQWYETDWTGVGYRADFTREPGPGGDAPYAVAYPYFERSRETILLPPNAGFTEDSYSSHAEVDETVAGIEYRRHASLKGNTFTIERSERSVAPEFAAADAPAFEKRLRELRDKRVYLRMPNGYRPTEGDLAVLTSAEISNVTDLMAQGNELLNGGRFDDAAARFARVIESEPDNALAWANRGVALARGRKLVEAEESLDRAEALDASNWVIYNGRAVLAEAHRDFAAAAEFYAKGLKLSSQNGFARAGLANARMNLGQADLALEELAAEIDKDPQLVEAYALQAFVLMMSRRRDEVPPVLEALMAANPASDRAKDLAGRLYMDLGMPEKARALVGDALPAATPYAWLTRANQREPGDVEGRLADLGEALKIEPTFAPALMMRAQAYYLERRYDEALADTAALIRSDRASVDAYLLRANIFRSMGRRDDAIAEAKTIVSTNPDQAFAHVAAGKIYARFDMRAEALAEIDRALAIKPEAYIYVNRSEIREPGDWDTQLADLDEALRLEPGSVHALYAKAYILREKGEPAAAAEVYSQLLEQEQPHAGLYNSRGMALAKAGRTTEAEADFTRARELAVDAEGLNNICYNKVLADVALERALEECNESLRLQPDTPATLDSRGAVLLRLGRLDEAIRDFDAALEQVPTMTNSLYLRAVARSRKGDSAGVEADLARVRELSPQLIGEMERIGLAVAGESSASSE